MHINDKLQEWFGCIINHSLTHRYPALPSFVLLFLALVLLWISRVWWVRWAGYLAVLLAMFLGFVIYYGGGQLGDLKIGPFPKGTPIDLLLNTNPDADPAKVKKVLHHTISKLGEIESKHLTEADALKVMEEQIAPALMEISKCPDFVMDGGHYYPWFDTMTDDDKNALIELLKTF